MKYPRSDIDEVITAIGSRISPAIYGETKAIFAPLQKDSSPVAVSIHRDIPYGSHSLQTLDIYRNSELPSDANVLMFVHGGGFVGGDKHEDGGPFFDNVGHWAASHGLVAVIINYRLAPQFAWPAGRDDVWAALEWTHQSIHSYGGSARRIALMGHSAGAAHAAACLADRDEVPGRPRAIAAFIGVSGIYDLRVPPVNTAYFGTQESLYKDRSPLLNILQSDVPLFFAIAQYDPAFVEQHFLSVLEGRLESRNKLPNFMQVFGHNHFSTVLQLSPGDSAFGEAVAGFIALALDGK